MIENFIIDLKINNFLPDYILYYKVKHQKSLKKLLFKLALSIIVFLLIKALADWPIIESMSFALIILITNFVLFKIYDLLTIDKKLKKVINNAYKGKMNLILEPTFIDLDQYGRKRTIFLSQLTKCILQCNIIFFIEKSDKYLPFKINRSEMKDESFQKLIKRLRSLGVIIQE